MRVSIIFEFHLAAGENGNEAASVRLNKSQLRFLPILWEDARAFKFISLALCVKARYTTAGDMILMTMIGKTRTTPS